MVAWPGNRSIAKAGGGNAELRSNGPDGVECHVAVPLPRTGAMLEAPPSEDFLARMIATVPYEDVASDSDTEVSSAAVPYEDLTPRSAGHSATLVCLHGLDRIHRVRQCLRHSYINQPPLSHHTDL